MRIGRLAAIAAALALGGCAQYIWVKPGATQADFNVDSGQCQMYAMSVPQIQAPYVPPTYTSTTTGSATYTGMANYGYVNGSATTVATPNYTGQAMANLGAAIGNAARHDQAIRACMMSKGYTLEEKQN
jgi:hypothetical protein